MKRKRLISYVEVYNSVQELTVADRKLLAAARKALKHSYSPYSAFQVGAAVLLSNGKVVTGSNQENAAYPMCLCAERSALAAASARYPTASVVALAVTAANGNGVNVDKPVPPCGACRQVLCEAEYRNTTKIRLIMQGQNGPIYILESCKDLLPLAFEGTFLNGE